MPLFSILENELSGILVLQSVLIYFGIETFRREASERPGLRKDKIRKSRQLQPMCPRSGWESAGDTRTHCLSALKLCSPTWSSSPNTFSFQPHPLTLQFFTGCFSHPNPQPSVSKRVQPIETSFRVGLGSPLGRGRLQGCTE